MTNQTANISGDDRRVFSRSPRRPTAACGDATLNKLRHTAPFNRLELLIYPRTMSLHPVRPMMATAARTLPTGVGWSYEVKWDGYRAMLLKNGTRTRLLSRNLKDLSSEYPHIVAATPRVTADAMCG
jgi:hypothetical protein